MLVSSLSLGLDISEMLFLEFDFFLVKCPLHSFGFFLHGRREGVGELQVAAQLKHHAGGGRRLVNLSCKLP